MIHHWGLQYREVLWKQSRNIPPDRLKTVCTRESLIRKQELELFAFLCHKKPLLAVFIFLEDKTWQHRKLHFVKTVI